jgi:phytoene dehydrogenase-like protein
MHAKHDAIVIGAGHNGLVTACYLARAGWKVLVLERRHVVGGACVTEETFPGFKVSTAAYVCSLFNKQIAADLGLASHGYELLERSPSSYSPFPDGRHLLLGPDAAMNHREICKFSARDADAYPKYEAMLERLAGVIEPTLGELAPDIVRPGLGDLARLFKLGRRMHRLGARGITEAVDVLTGSARAVLDRWFESEQLKATIATDAVIGAMAAPSTPGTGYVLFHHVMGETNGKRGVWAYVRGGMGGLTQALAGAARKLGVEIRTGADVAKILVEGGAVAGVALIGGDEHRAAVVASNADAHVTFRRLLAADQLPPDFAAAVDRIDYSSASMKINVALSELPRFTARPDGDGTHHLRGTIHLCPDQDFIERGHDDAKFGRPSRDPLVECCLPSVVDPTVAPPGRHLMSMFVQYAPYKLAEGTWDDRKDAFADRCFEMVEQYAPGFTASVIDRQVLSPLDLERTFGLTGGNISQGAMTLGQLFVSRPAPGWTGHRTPIRGLYLCGAATHPGGGVMGHCGRNAAREMLRRE